MKPSFRLGALALPVVLGVAGAEGEARADEGVKGKGVDPGLHGLAVVGVGSSVDAAWPLARAVYADPALRPPALDEAHARALVGDPVAAGAAPDLVDLAESRAALHGDDAASRRLLDSLARSLHVQGLVVVELAATNANAPSNAKASARVFLASSGTFDAARYESEAPAPVTWGAGASAVTWGGAVQSLHRAYGEAPPANPSPSPPPPPVSNVSPGTARGAGRGAAHPLAIHAVPANPADDASTQARRPFYKSPWFWAAAGAAVFAAGAVYLATRNDGSNNIQLQVAVPK